MQVVGRAEASNASRAARVTISCSLNIHELTPYPRPQKQSRLGCCLLLREQYLLSKICSGGNRAQRQLQCVNRDRQAALNIVPQKALYATISSGQHISHLLVSRDQATHCSTEKIGVPKARRNSICPCHLSRGRQGLDVTSGLQTWTRPMRAWASSLHRRPSRSLPWTLTSKRAPCVRSGSRGAAGPW